MTPPLAEDGCTQEKAGIERHVSNSKAAAATSITSRTPEKGQMVSSRSGGETGQSADRAKAVGGEQGAEWAGNCGRRKITADLPRCDHEAHMIDVHAQRAGNFCYLDAKEDGILTATGPFRGVVERRRAAKRRFCASPHRSRCVGRPHCPIGVGVAMAKAPYAPPPIRWRVQPIFTHLLPLTLSTKSAEVDAELGAGAVMPPSPPPSPLFGPLNFRLVWRCRRHVLDL